MQTQKYIVPISTGTTKEGIKNDCVIRAIVNATGKSYEEVEAWALKFTDYKLNSAGINARGVASIFANFGIEFVAAVGGTKTARWWDRYYQGKKTTGSTVGKMLECLDSGTYIVHFKGHVFCVKNKQIIDTYRINKNRYCTAVWKYLG
jgi:hypothetical protein